MNANHEAAHPRSEGDGTRTRNFQIDSLVGVLGAARFLGGDCLAALTL